MADIHVEKRNAIWPWILGLVVLALLIWAFVGGTRDDRAGVTTGATTTGATDTWETDRTDTARTDTWATDTTTTAGTGTAGVTTDDTWAGTTGTAGTMADTGQPGATAGFGTAQQPLPVADIREQPEQFLQQTVTGTARVAEVDNERNGLWIEQNNERLFVAIARDGFAQPGLTGADTAQTQAATGTQQTQAATGTQQTQAATGTQTQPALAGQRGMAVLDTLQPGQSVQLTAVVMDAQAATTAGIDANAQQVVQNEPAFLLVQPDDLQLAQQTGAARTGQQPTTQPTTQPRGG